MPVRGQTWSGGRWSFSWHILRRSVAASGHVTVPVALASLHHTKEACASHIITGRARQVQHNKIFWERERLHSRNVYHSTLLSFLLVIFVNLLLCLICKLDFITGIQVQEKNKVEIAFGTMHGFRHPPGVLTRTLSKWGGRTVQLCEKAEPSRASSSAYELQASFFPANSFLPPEMSGIFQVIQESILGPN